MRHRLGGPYYVPRGQAYEVWALTVANESDAPAA